MNKYLNHGYIVSLLLDCGVNKSLMSKQIFANMTIQHRPRGIYNVDYTRSLDS
jgi:hypothetical protein